MPAALLRECAFVGGCVQLVESGLCPTHARQREQAKGTRQARGMGAGWYAFKDWVGREMLRLGITRVCGASLPGGPAMAASQCKRAGRLVERSSQREDLHLHHDPPLTNAEREDQAKVCDPLRVGFLCRSCHSAETQREMQAGRV